MSSPPPPSSSSSTNTNIIGGVSYQQLYNEPNGWSLEFVQEVDEDFLCAICQLLIKEPMETVRTEIHTHTYIHTHTHTPLSASF